MYEVWRGSCSALASSCDSLWSTFSNMSHVCFPLCVLLFYNSFFFCFFPFMKSKWKEALCVQQHVAFKIIQRPKTCVSLALLLQPNLEIHPKGPDTPWNRSSNANERQQNANFSRPHQTRGEDVFQICEANKVWRSVFCAKGETKESTTSSSDNVLVMAGLKKNISNSKFYPVNSHQFLRMSVGQCEGLLMNE